MKKMILMVALSLGVMFSGILGPVNAEAASNYKYKAAVVSQKYIGVKYKWGGTTPKGFDCSGFVKYTYKLAGKNLPRTAAQMYKQGKAVSKSKLQKGNLVFFRTTSSKAVSHVGIYLGNNKFIHASSSKGVRVESMNNSYWKTKYVGAKNI